MSGGWDGLAERLAGLPGAVVAVSGGVDSAVLLAAAADLLGPERTLAVVADSPSLARSELAAAERLASRLGVELIRLATRETEDPRYRANTGDRCFWCKEALFAAAEPIARARGWPLCYGENADDDPADRPGSRSAAARGVRAPLREAGWGKARIRARARELGLEQADKPAMPCLASRIPVGVEVGIEALRRIEAFEGALRRRGYRELRGRDLPDGTVRLELAAEELPRAEGEREELAALARASGYRRLELAPR
ncbi:MAG: ATP-binding protein [Planctomycetota bacterium]|nr:MAG: ATP-binding protein [Planctomycetota bacterium]